MSAAFRTALECLRDLERRNRAEGYMNFFHRCDRNKKAGLKQLRCAACGRWKWPEDRCNLFTADADYRSLGPSYAPPESP